MTPRPPEDASVYTTHLRRYPGYRNPMTRGMAILSGIEAKPLAKGGLTLVQVELADGRTLRGAAQCSAADNYNRAVGRMIALGRALKAAA